MNIVGNYFFSLMIFCVASLQVQERLELRICDMRNQPLASVGVGQPCILEVVMHNTTTSMQVPQVHGIETFSPSRTGVRVSTINGVSSVTHTYKIRIDTPGTYTIGPAVLHGLSSEPLTITVADQQVMAQPAKQQRKQQQASVTPIAVVLQVDTDQVVVGQEVVCTLLCFYDPAQVTVRQLSVSDTPHLIVRDIQEGVVKQEMRNGVMLHVVQWQWYAYPQKEGQITIPACSVEATMHNNAHSQQWGAFSLLFNVAQMNERFYSNGVTITVDPLPAYDKPFAAVGLVTDFSATFEPAVAREGEAMIMTVQVKGKMDFARLSSCSLVNMPPEFKYYPSEQKLTTPFPCGIDRTKSYTFIVQAQKKGMYTIPEQHFTYFDVVRKKFVTKSTAPISVDIHAGQATSAISNGSDSVSDEKKQKSVATFVPVTPAVFADDEPVPLTFAVFCVTLLIPLCVSLGIMGYRRRRFYLSSAHARYTHAYKKARARLDKQETQQQASQVYHIFITLIHERLMILPSQACLDDITAIVRRKDLSYDVVERWENFVQEMGAYAFGNKQMQEKAVKLFFCTARQWLVWCEGEF
ncbi:MAG TPA: BatD family protein [Candidatus Bathyarchaeia archaeon]|nr:BatD family protein [Candidatus Bathyarchaeia archaeon]